MRVTKDYLDLAPRHPEWPARLRWVCGLCVEVPADPQEVSRLVALRVAKLSAEQVWLMLRQLDRTRELELSIDRYDKQMLQRLIIRSVLHGTVWTHIIEAGAKTG